MIFKRSTFAGNVFFGVTLLVALPAFLTAQSDKCSDSDLRAVLQPADQAYTMAAALAKSLRAHDFIIKRALRSKMDGAFEGQDSAALFRTNRGDFEAMFLPKQMSFEKLEVLERRENGWYFYSFEGDPKPLSGGIQSPRPNTSLNMPTFCLKRRMNCLPKICAARFPNIRFAQTGRCGRGK
jgi:hypothetical protein